MSSAQGKRTAKLSVKKLLGLFADAPLLLAAPTFFATILRFFFGAVDALDSEDESLSFELAAVAVAVAEPDGRAIGAAEDEAEDEADRRARTLLGSSFS